MQGINWRSYVVCDVSYPNVNNWLWTPFIERGDANRIYIEIKVFELIRYRHLQVEYLGLYKSSYASFAAKTDFFLRDRLQSLKFCWETPFYL
jgi:hypothetical protein